MNERKELDKLRKLYKEMNKKDDDYRKTDAFKKLTEDEKQVHDTIFWQTETGEIDADISELEIDWIKDAKNVAVTSGASTPTPITKEVITFLEQFDPNNSINRYTTFNGSSFIISTNANHTEKSISGKVDATFSHAIVIMMLAQLCTI